MSFDLVTILVSLIWSIVVNLIFVAPFLWIAGRLLAGKQNAKGTDALWIVLIGTVVFYFFNLFLSDYISGSIATLIAYFVMLVIWLALVKHFFDCGWLKALAISIIAVIIAIIVIFIIFLILAALNIGTGWIPVANPLNSI
jgi:hypothetical protein